MPPGIEVDLARQRLRLASAAGSAGVEYTVSTAVNGAGERESSFATPRGRHRVRAKIGAGAALGTVFKARRPTGEVYSAALAAAAPRRDWILTRILWLCGCEPGFNRHGAVDTMRRFIYIHGAAPTAEMGRPGSIGCIRMNNHDVVDLFDRVAVGTCVWIHE